MEQFDKQFLEENITNWETAKSGYVRNLDKTILDRYVLIYKKYINPNFVFTSWCGGCRLDMVLKLYDYYSKLPQPTLEEIQENFVEEPIVPEVKKRGRKPKN